MAFVILIIAVLLASGVHYIVRRDTTSALAFGAGLLVFALVPALVGLYGG